MVKSVIAKCHSDAKSVSFLSQFARISVVMPSIASSICEHLIPQSFIWVFSGYAQVTNFNKTSSIFKISFSYEP